MSEVFAKFTRIGCSTKQGPHQEANTLRSHTFPSMSEFESRASNSLSIGKVNSGAAFPIKGDGTSFGLSDKPFQRNTVIPKKRNKGIKNLVAVIIFAKNDYLKMRQSSLRDSPRPDSPFDSVDRKLPGLHREPSKTRHPKSNRQMVSNRHEPPKTRH